VALLILAPIAGISLACRVWPRFAVAAVARLGLIRKRLWVVFDNNAYRSLSESRFTALQACETRRGIKGLASYWVAIELLSHMADPADADFGSAWAAIRRLWRHCSEGRNIRWLADSENHVCHTLFGAHIPNRQSEAASYGLLIGTIANAQDQTEWHHLQAALDHLASHVIGIEQQFRDDMWQYVVLSVNPQAGSWRPLDATSPLRKQLLEVFQSDRGRNLSARMIVLKAAAQLGKSLSDSELAEKTDLVRAAFPIAVEFYNAVLTRIVEVGFDLDQGSKRNSIWDLQIAFSASPAARLQGCPVWLVTDDRLLRTAATKAGAASVIRSLVEYEALVTGSLSAFLAQLSGTPVI